MITNGERRGVLDIDRVCSYQKDNIKNKNILSAIFIEIDIRVWLTGYDKKHWLWDIQELD